jgi:iron complex transport system ATP-binding protein
MRLELADVTAVLEGRRVLGPINLKVHGHERIALVGPNGAGKSTLLRRMAGLMGGDGRITLNSTQLDHLTKGQRARAISFLPQQRQIAWPIPVRDLVALGRMPHGADPSHVRGDDQAAVMRALARLDLEDWAERPATALSQGEQARVLLARVLATEAPLLLADEPIAALDPRHQLETLGVLAEEADAGRSVIAVLHDLALASQWASRVILLVDGHVLADGPAAVALTPAHVLSAFGVVMRGENGCYGFVLPGKF